MHGSFSGIHKKDVKFDCFLYPYSLLYSFIVLKLGPMGMRAEHDGHHWWHFTKLNFQPHSGWVSLIVTFLTHPAICLNMPEGGIGKLAHFVVILKNKHLFFIRQISKGCCQKMWCFRLYYFGLGFLKENDIYPILLFWIWKFYRVS